MEKGNPIDASSPLDAVACIEGPNLTLRLVQQYDAEYIHALRINPLYNQHLSAVYGSIADQFEWIESYKTREASLSELYYAIERKDGTRCGLVRLYDITDQHFTWGSWILDHNKPRKAALESAVLSFSVGFGLLDLPQAFIDVRIGNLHALQIYLRLGMTEIGRDERDIYLTYHRKQFRADLSRHTTIISGVEA